MLIQEKFLFYQNGFRTSTIVVRVLVGCCVLAHFRSSIMMNKVVFVMLSKFYSVVLITKL